MFGKDTGLMGGRQVQPPQSIGFGPQEMKGTVWSDRDQALVAKDPQGQWRIVEGSEMHGKEMELGGKRFVWDGNAKNRNTGRPGAWREIARM